MTMSEDILILSTHRKKFTFFLIVLAVMLSACNGGGSEEPPPEGNEQNKAQLSVNTKTLDFGAVVTSQTLTITNSGGEVLRWQIGWLNQGIQPAWVVSVSPSSGELTESQSVDVTVVIDRASLSEGSHSDIMLIQVPGLSETVTLNVSKTAPGNQLPIVSIISPDNNANSPVDDAINFTGTATDPEDGALPVSALSWSSNRDGDLGVGSSVNVYLSPGTHQITLSAVDSQNAVGSTSISITVNQPPPIAWQITNGPYGGIVNDIVENVAGHLFVATGYAGANGTGAGRNGIFRSTDRGANWQQVNNGLTNKYVNTLMVSGNGDVFAGTYFGGVFKSTDNGDSWSVANNGITESAPAPIVDAFVQTANGSIYAGLRQGGVFYSSDNGATWNALNNGIPANTSVRDLVSNTNNDVFMLGTGVVMRLPAGSDTWEDVSPAQTVFNSITIDTNNNVFLGWYGSTFHSTTNGDTWIELAFPVTDYIRFIAADSQGNLYAMAYRGSIYQRASGSTTWTDVTNDVGRTDYQIFKVLNNDVFAAGTGNGVYLSTDRSVSWNEFNNGLHNSLVLSLLGNSAGKMFAGTSGGVFRSDDQGTTWLQKNSGLPKSAKVVSILENSNNMYVGLDDVGSSNAGVIYQSNDEGDTWTVYQPALSTDYSVTNLVINSDGDIFAATGSATPAGRGIYRHLNGTADWQQINNGLTNINISTLALDSAGRIFAGSSGGGLFVSTNNGDLWQPVIGLPSGATRVTAMVIDRQDNIFVAVNISATNTISMFVSIDNGLTWEAAGKGIYNSPIRTMIVDQNNTVYAAAFSQVYRTQNQGRSWGLLQVDVETSLNKDALSLALDANGLLYVGLDGGGVFRSVEAVVP
jgi:photosystem II stability/assembly factor-like uncharacterized protein